MLIEMKEIKKPTFAELDAFSFDEMSRIRGGESYMNRNQNQNNNQKFDFTGNQNGYKVGPVYLTGQ